MQSVEEPDSSVGKAELSPLLAFVQEQQKTIIELKEKMAELEQRTSVLGLRAGK